MARPDSDWTAAARPYVRVRVTDMAGVDLDVYRFDYDLTFCALLMHPDGTIYHTFGGRDATSAESHLDMEAFTRVLVHTLEDHARHRPRERKKNVAPARTIETLPPMARRIREGNAPECFHCHNVNDAVIEQARADGVFDRTMAFAWPDPVEVGIRLDRREQTRIVEVVPDSAAARAGLREGDIVLTVAGREVATFGDVQRALRDTPGARGRVRLEIRRGGETVPLVVPLQDGWKEPQPETFAWRAIKWNLSPKPGFGGPRLSPAELDVLGLPRDRFAFRVQYIVTWGPNAHTGRNAARSGLRQGDVVLSVGGKSDFESVDHFHAWFRLTRRAGERVPIEILRGGQRETITLVAVE